MAFSYIPEGPGEPYHVTLFTFDLFFDDQQFHCLVRARANDNTVLYSLTPLNSEMEEVFSKPYQLTEQNGVLNIEAPIKTAANTDLEFALGIALRNYLAQNNSPDEIRARFIA